MQDTQLLTEGVALMGLGMGFVFVFLTILVMTTTLMSKLIGRFFPEPVAPVRPAVQSSAVTANDELMVVIGAAVHRYRHRR